MHNKIGRYGARKPKETLLGVPVDDKPMYITRVLSGQYYCVQDIGDIPNVEELIDELRKEVPGEPKRKRATVATESDQDTTV